MSKWQPIETAPHDGRPILLARKMGPPWGWVRGWGYWASLNDKRRRRDLGGWICHGFFDPPGELGLGAPTHWQPLPDPPK